MNNRETESRLRRAYEHATPDVLDAIRVACSQTKGEMISMTNKTQTFLWTKLLAVAAALVLVVGAVAGLGLYRRNHPTTTVSLDVNPALSISLNKDETVLAVTPRNEEARRVVGDMELAGNDLTLVVNALIGSMLRQGYLDDSHNSILVSVEDTDTRRGEALQKKLAGQIDGLLHTDTLDGAVLSQTVDAGDDELKTLAEKYGISLGKARLIQQIITQNTRHTFDELAGLTVHELNLISSDGTGSKLENVTANGTASDKGYIGVEAAKTAATFDAIGDTEPAITWLDAVEMDYENGRMVYEVEFAVDGVEYEYDIDALTGAVVKKYADPLEDAPATPGTDTSAEAAKAAALQDAGLTADKVSGLKVERETEEGRTVYEVEFTAEGVEYDYLIDALTGEVLDKDVDREDDRPGTTTRRPSAPETTTATASSQSLTAEQAKAAALAHAGVRAADIRDYACALDREDGVLVYEIEFSSGNTDYEYLIEAATGKIVEYERDRDD